MAIMFSMMPATMFVVIGFFILFTATKGQGFISRFGQILAIWIFIIAISIIIHGTYITFTGKCPMMGEKCPMIQWMKYGEIPAQN
ncbi:MAG: hypothetical protein JSV93_01590 [Candidatus Omnitrophota bacterium]|nr:MAG: hypothetical protein JSV93_01590 [Candidatus Omnitrophota bacterium]